MSTDTGLYLKNLGNKIANIRIQKKISQYKLAKILFMEQSNLDRIEEGRTNPTVKTLLKICDSLEISLSRLFEDL